MIRVQVRPSEPLEAALRRFKRQCNFAGIFRLAKKYNYHEKRSDKMRRERRERLRTLQRAERRLMGPRTGGRGRRRQRTRVSRVKPEDRQLEDDEKGAPEGISAVMPTAAGAFPRAAEGADFDVPVIPPQGSGTRQPAAEASAE